MTYKVVLRAYDCAGYVTSWDFCSVHASVSQQAWHTRGDTKKEFTEQKVKSAVYSRKLDLTSRSSESHTWVLLLLRLDMSMSGRGGGKSRREQPRGG